MLTLLAETLNPAHAFFHLLHKSGSSSFLQASLKEKLFLTLVILLISLEVFQTTLSASNG